MRELVKLQLHLAFYFPDNFSHFEEWTAVTYQRCDPALPRFHVSLMGAFSAPEPRQGGLLGCFPARARAWLSASKHPKYWLCAPKQPKPELESVPLYTRLVIEAPRLNP